MISDMLTALDARHILVAITGLMLVVIILISTAYRLHSSPRDLDISRSEPWEEETAEVLAPPNWALLGKKELRD